MKKENLTFMGVFLALSMSAAGLSAGSVGDSPYGGAAEKVASASNYFKLPEDVYGSGLYAYSLTNYRSEMGLYNISLDGELTYLWTPETTDSYLFNGWINNGNLCGINTKAENGVTTILRYDELDFDSGKLISSVDLDPANHLNFFRQCVYIPETNRVFGVGFDEKEWSCIKYLDMDDLSATVITNINYTKYIYGICYNPIDKNVYAVTESNKLVRIDQETGDYEELMDLPLLPSMKKNYVHGLTYLPSYDEYLFSATSDNYDTFLYRIDLESGIMIEVSKLLNAEEITFFINTDEGDPESPLRPQYVSQSFTGGELTGSFNYTLPTMLAGGEEATGNLTWTLLVDGVEAATGEGMPGAEAVATVTVEQGLHLLEMYAANNGHRGPTSKNYVFVGNDTPKAPNNVVLEEGLVKWDAVTEGVKGGYLNLDDLFYEVYINNEYIGETTETELAFTVSEDMAYGKYIAEVKAICSDIESQSGVSNSALYGSPLKLDATFAPTAEEAALFTCLSNGGYDVMWSFSESDQVFTSTIPWNSSDCYLVTPPMQFSDPEAIYSVAFDARLNDGWGGGEPILSVYLMKSISVGDEVKTILSEFSAQKYDYKNYSGIFSIPEEGAYYIAFKCSSPMYSDVANVKNITVSLTDVPADSPTMCTDITAEGAPEGKLSAEVTLTLPATDLIGREIPADTEVTATVKCGENTASVSGAPGSVQKLEIATVQGMNEIIVESSIGEKVGESTSVTVFTGKDRPGMPKNLKATVDRDNLTVSLTWEHPTEGAEGHYFDAEGLNYKLTYKSGWSTKEMGEITDGSQEFVFTFPESESLSQTTINLIPTNVEGEGTTAKVNVVIGKPYTLPMNEALEYNMVRYTPVALEYPSEEYESSSLQIVYPYQLQSFFEKYDHYAIAAVSGFDGESRTRLVLPKFCTIYENQEEAKTVRASFEIWTGDMVASEITLLGKSYDIEEPVEIGKVEPGTGWSVVDFNLPQELMNKEWITIMFDSKCDSAPEYTMIYTYDIDFSELVGVDGINASDASLYANGRYVYINGLEGSSYAICTLDGRVVKSGVVADPALAIGLEKGVYVVRAGGKSAKVVIR